MTELQQAARQALTLMDLTSLNDDDTDAAIEALCQRAQTPVGSPAAVCVYPAFVVTARRALTAYRLNDVVKIATVTNFPTAATMSWRPPGRHGPPWPREPTRWTWCFPIAP